MRLAIMGIIGVFLILLAVAVSGPGASGSMAGTNDVQVFGSSNFADRIGLASVAKGHNEDEPPATDPYLREPGQSASPDDPSASPPRGRDAGIWGEPAQFAPTDPVS